MGPATRSDEITGQALSLSPIKVDIRLGKLDADHRTLP
jgi:hypothetical protein